MEKYRNMKALVVVVLIIVALSLTIAFAAMSRTLIINGNARVSSADWDIHYQNLQSSKTGGATIVEAPTIKNNIETNENSTVISDFVVSLTKPGDSVTFSVDVINAGGIDAKSTSDKLFINGIAKTNIESDLDTFLSETFVKADWDGDGQTTAEERAKAWQNIAFTVTEPDSNGNYELNKNGSKNFSITIEYKQSSTELPKGEIELEIEVKQIYEQV